MFGNTQMEKTPTMLRPNESNTAPINDPLSVQINPPNRRPIAMPMPPPSNCQPSNHENLSARRIDEILENLRAR